MGIFNKFKQAKELIETAKDPEAWRFVLTYDLIQSGYDGATAGLVARVSTPLMSDPFNREFEDSIRIVSFNFSTMIGTIRKSVPVELTIEDAQEFMLKNALGAVDQYIKLAQLHDITYYSSYSEWLEIKQVIEQAGYTSN